jgi:hypothetical protein
MFRRKPVPDLIRDGHRFADKNMRQAGIDSHFRSNGWPESIQFDRKWL